MYLFIVEVFFNIVEFTKNVVDYLNCWMVVGPVLNQWNDIPHDENGVDYD